MSHEFQASEIQSFVRIREFYSVDFCLAIALCRFVTEEFIQHFSSVHIEINWTEVRYNFHNAIWILSTFFSSAKDELECLPRIVELNLDVKNFGCNIETNLFYGSKISQIFRNSKYPLHCHFRFLSELYHLTIEIGRRNIANIRSRWGPESLQNLSEPKAYSKFTLILGNQLQELEQFVNQVPKTEKLQYSVLGVNYIWRPNVFSGLH